MFVIDPKSIRHKKIVEKNHSDGIFDEPFIRWGTIIRNKKKQTHNTAANQTIPRTIRWFLRFRCWIRRKIDQNGIGLELNQQQYKETRLIGYNSQFIQIKRCIPDEFCDDR